MVNYKKTQLNNGLRLIVHEDPSTPLVAVNLLYDVGARDEQANKTGFAHLFEHLMFEGSLHIPDFDHQIHRAGGESNAFTSNDITNYYDIVPSNNLETVFWLESDRMLGLNFSEQNLAIQKEVVCEEFKESCLNQPYGDAWHKLRALTYKKHPYRWPVIGKEMAHIAQANLTDVQQFFYKYYRPNNAILVVAGGVAANQVEQLAHKWFADIPSGQSFQRHLPKELTQTACRTQRIRADVPLDALYMAFPCCDRYHPDYHTYDLITELLSGGSSGRLDQTLVREQQLFAQLNTYLTGSFDEGLLVIYGKLTQGITLAAAEQAIWQELRLLQTELIAEIELEKVKNRVESTIAFSEIGIGSKAFNLAYFELMGDIDEINYEMNKYTHINATQVQRVAQSMFRRENCSILYYEKK